VTRAKVRKDNLGAKPHTHHLPPPLKWAGGKRWLAPRLAEMYRPFRHLRWAEPFVGGLGVALYIRPERALLNDINHHVINFYRWLQQGLVFTIPLKNDPDVYYEHRRRFNELIRQGREHTEEAAMLFYYLNRTGFNGLCRFNKKGEFNVPFGRYKTINYITDFTPYSEALRNWEFTSMDFEALALGEEDFIYADPPYDVEFTSYSSISFTWQDQVRLARWLAKHAGPVVVSNQATARILELYEGLGFHIEIVEAPRRISSNGNREPALEMLAWRNLSSDHMTPRNTNTGNVLEVMMQHALSRGGYTYFLRGSGKTAQRTFDEPIPSTKTRHKFILDGLAICPNTGERIGLSAKWQQVGGTAEEKVALETLRLLKLIERGDIDRAYLIMGGDGWSLRDYFLSEDFINSFASPARDRVRLVTLEQFISLANATQL